MRQVRRLIDLWRQKDVSQRGPCWPTAGCRSSQSLLQAALPEPREWFLPCLKQWPSNNLPTSLCTRVYLFSSCSPFFSFFPVYTEQTAWETQFLHCKPSHTWAEGSEIFRFIKKELGDRAGGMTLTVKCFHQSIGTWVWPPDPTSKSWADTVPERGRQEDPWRLLESQSEQTDELQFQCLGPVSR